ncbi:uncharacterized protein ACN427_007367 [Glossina fuscipes fuscipes]
MSYKSEDILETKSEKGSGGSNYLKLQQSQVIRSSLQGISQLLNTGLSDESLDISIKLIEAGVHPQALAEVITQIRREAESTSDESKES